MSPRAAAQAPQPWPPGALGPPPPPRPPEDRVAPPPSKAEIEALARREAAAKAKALQAARRTARAAKEAKAAAEAKPAPKAKAAPERADGLRAGSKMAAAIDMLCAKRGASCAEIAKALGWSALNAATLKGYAARAKVKVCEDGSESPTRFFGTAKA